MMRTGRAALGLALAVLVSGGLSPAQQESQAGDAVAFEGQISGTVYTSDKGYVSGTSVAVVGGKDPTIRGTNTDTRGRYAIKGLPRDQYAVLVMDPSGHLLRKDRVNVRPLFRNLVDFITGPPGAPEPVLPSLPGGETVELPSFTLEVELVSREGQPLAEAWVTAAPLSDEYSSRRARSDSGGELIFPDLPAGYYRLSARALGQVTWSLGPLLLQGPEDRRLQLSLVPFPLGHEERIENLIVPIQPARPEAFDAETAPAAAAEGDGEDPSESDS